MRHTVGNYDIEVLKEPYYDLASADNVCTYDSVYFDDIEYQFSTLIGVKVFEADVILKSALVAGDGGATGLHKTSHIIETTRIVICCSDTIFCLSIPDLSLLWKTKADMATCFEIYRYGTDYIVHGELEITRLGHNGEIIWQQGGADIFTSLNSTEKDFIITPEYILATDWENRKYKFDFDGKLIN